MNRKIDKAFGVLGCEIEEREKKNENHDTSRV